MSDPEVKVKTDIGSVADAAKTMFELFTAAIPPTQVRVDRATARLPFLKGLTEKRLKKLREKELQHWVKVVEKNGYDPLAFVKFENQHAEATPLDSLQAFLIQQAIKK